VHRAAKSDKLYKISLMQASSLSDQKAWINSFKYTYLDLKKKSRHLFKLLVLTLNIKVTTNLYTCKENWLKLRAYFRIAEYTGQVK